MIFPSGVILLKVKHTLVNMLKGIVYTTIFGGYDNPIEQNLPEGWDWKCFSEKNSLSLYTDSNRDAKKIICICNHKSTKFFTTYILKNNFIT